MYERGASGGARGARAAVWGERGMGGDVMCSLIVLLRPHVSSITAMCKLHVHMHVHVHDTMPACEHVHVHVHVLVLVHVHVHVHQCMCNIVQCAMCMCSVLPTVRPTNRRTDGGGEDCLNTV